ncbi:perosamine synthetase [Tistlia consotensis]|uniref:Perosamine synthetase n=1 Tax=Tistlia consotensis USBA 355 TaxID=560819 RepID=A0A1Y6BA19_9PROT|nr:DegT/DnrJ/EryC1/StrS family aminotransferase [Tistlia consotensis]SME99339.1 perosamine synthetase [Tistlia consotensis USBA 355]SNR77046.1 perosamine synthetase [Tistlia consotensis]
MQRIPQVSPWLGEDESAAVAQVVADGWITEGPASAAFSEALDRLIGAPFGVFAPNGTLALALALMALDIGPGDEVLVPDTTFVGSATAVVLAGARPVFVDVEPETFQLDVGRAAAALTGRTRAVMAVHLYGTACDMDALGAFAARHGLRVVEDAAQGIGVTWKGRHVGALGDLGCFSFFADKTITTGEGGYVACRDPALHERLRQLRNQGRSERGSFVHPAIGFNFRITDLQAAMGLVQLGKLPQILARKTALHARYRDALAGLPQIRVLGAAPGAGLVPFRCVLIAERAAELSAHLEAAGVQIRGFFPPLHRQPCFAEGREAQPDSRFPNAIAGHRDGLCLPIFPTLAEAQVERIGALVRDFYGSG